MLPVVGYPAKFSRVCVLVMVLSNTLSAMTYLFVQLSFQWKFLILDNLCRPHVGLMFAPLTYWHLSSNILCPSFLPAIVLLLGLSADFHLGLHVCSPPHCLESIVSRWARPLLVHLCLLLYRLPHRTVVALTPHFELVCVHVLPGCYFVRLWVTCLGLHSQRLYVDEESTCISIFC